ncbi:hypothetical protein [Halomontanus rarus]|uniref:hypothetical protein n=1 Tax=Halomontanus rarus TaxID=3034020 RepID=UPI0023E83C21|nr:hypothetical protein [Halovivax sp. TS33]
MPLVQELFFLLLGGLLGAWIQGRKEKMKRLRENIFQEIGDEIQMASINGYVHNDSGVSKWGDIDPVSKKALPSPIREEFARYFQRLPDVEEQQAVIRNIKESMAAQYPQKIEFLQRDNGGLNVATSHELIDQDQGVQTIYGVSFDDWLLEFGPVVIDVLSEAEQGQVMNKGEEIEKAVRAHVVENGDLENIDKVWDKLVGQGDWGDDVLHMFVYGPARRLLLHMQLLEEAKEDVKESAEELDVWMGIISNTTIALPYWIRVKKKVADPR